MIGISIRRFYRCPSVVVVDGSQGVRVSSNKKVGVGGVLQSGAELKDAGRNPV
jgi:hypothetical protein